MRPLTNLRSELRAKLLELRSLSRIVHDELFSRMYEAANAEAKLAAEELIAATDVDGLTTWLRTHIKGAKILEEYSMKELRATASRLKVAQYRYMTRQMLIAVIKQKDKQKEIKS